jgi:hypothetical protein
MGPIGCPETSVMNYHYLPNNNPEERSSDLLRCGSLQSHIHFSYFPRVFMIIRHFACSHYVNNCVKQARRFWLSEEPPVTVPATLESSVWGIAEYVHINKSKYKAFCPVRSRYSFFSRRMSVGRNPTHVEREATHRCGNYSRDVWLTGLKSYRASIRGINIADTSSAGELKQEGFGFADLPESVF